MVQLLVFSQPFPALSFSFFLSPHVVHAVAIQLYPDLVSYRSGVYKHDAELRSTGQHCVTLYGWGEEGGEKYWLAKNRFVFCTPFLSLQYSLYSSAHSWGDTFGDGGFFKIARGTNECGLEDRFFFFARTPRRITAPPPDPLTVDTAASASSLLFRLPLPAVVLLATAAVLLLLILVVASVTLIRQRVHRPPYQALLPASPSPQVVPTADAQHDTADGLLLPPDEETHPSL
jgi:hypothetical protein